MPSPNRICNVTVGAESSTLTVDGAAELELAVPLAGAAGVAAGGGATEVAPGVGLPNRWPEPEKGTYFFFGFL